MPKTKSPEEELNALPSALSAEDEFNSLPSDEMPLTPTGLPPLVQDAAELATTPQRGFRGIGVGMEKALEGVSPMAFMPGGTPTPQEASMVAQNIPTAIERASAAVQPGYNPEAGERIGSFVGEMIGSAPLTYALGGGPLAVTAPLSGKVALGALSAGTLSAIEQASERGDIKAIPMAVSAGIGGTIPLIGPTLKMIGRMLFGAGTIVATKVGVRPYAVEELRNNQNLLKDFQGDAEAIGAKVRGIQTSLKDVYDAASKNLDIERKRIGLPNFFGDDGVTDDALKAIEGKEFEPKDPIELISDFRHLRDAKNIPAKSRINALIRLRDDIRQMVSYKPGESGQAVRAISGREEGIFKGIANDINDIIWNPETKAGIPGGQKIREAEGAWSKARDLYDGLQKKLADESTGEQSLARIAYNDNLDELIGKDSAVTEMIKDLEKRTGKELLSPLRKELAVKAIKKLKMPANQGFFGSSVGDLVYGSGSTGLQRTVQTLDAIGAGVSKAGDFLFNPAARLAQIAAAAQTTR